MLKACAGWPAERPRGLAIWAGRVGEDEVAIAALSITELYPESSSLIDGALGEVGWGTEVLAMERKAEGNSKTEGD
jgi:hypothetical protein